MSKHAIEQVVAAYFAALRAMDLNAWVETFADDAVSHDPVGGPPVKGKEALRRFYRGLGGIFKKVELTEDRVFVAGHCAAVKWTGRAVGKNGREVTFEGIDVFEVNDEGKIQAVHGYWDPAALVAEVTGEK